MNKFRSLMFIAISFFLSIPVSVAMTSCKMTYNIKGWSIIYNQYKGNGIVSCENGESAYVRVTTRGAGLTFGKSDTINGKGSFSEVININEVYGTYVVLGGHAGAVKSFEGQAMTKGEVSLAISGKGRGFDLGVTIGAFTIRPKLSEYGTR